MSQRRDALHLDCIHIFKRMTQNSWGVDYLPTKVFVVEVFVVEVFVVEVFVVEVFVVEVSNEEAFGSKGVRQDVDVRAGDLVDEGRFADVRVLADQESLRACVDGRQPGHVLPEVLEVSKWIFLSVHDGSHTADATLAFI
jgi:hypothetical protein